MFAENTKEKEINELDCKGKTAGLRINNNNTVELTNGIKVEIKLLGKALNYADTTTYFGQLIGFEKKM